MKYELAEIIIKNLCLRRGKYERKDKSTFEGRSY